MSSDDTTVPNKPVDPTGSASIIVDHVPMIKMMARIVIGKGVPADSVGVMLVAPGCGGFEAMVELANKIGNGLVAQQDGYTAAGCTQEALLKTYDAIASSDKRSSSFKSAMPNDSIAVLLIVGNDEPSLMVGPKVQSAIEEFQQ